jgi:fluoride exporter
VSTVLLWVGVLALGGCGAVLRTSLGAEIDRHKRFAFPLGTFIVNISGAFAAGVLYGAVISDDAHFLFGTALIGAFTTFSTWMGDSERLLREGRVETALANVFISIVLGFGAVLLGKIIGESLF